MWFYATDGTSHGPVDLEQLVARLERTAEPSAVQVRRDGMLGWQQAGTIPELAARLSPPLARLPPPPPAPQAAALPQAAAPPPVSDAAVGPDGETPVAVVLAVATLGRRLVLAVGTQMFLGIAMLRFVIDRPSAFGLLVVATALVVSIATAVTVYRLMRLLEEGCRCSGRRRCSCRS